jgi:hypothetical protein
MRSHRQALVWQQELRHRWHQDQLLLVVIHPTSVVLILRVVSSWLVARLFRVFRLFVPEVGLGLRTPAIRSMRRC